MRFSTIKVNRWVIVSLVLLMSGCRGANPFSRSVQITKTSDTDGLEIDSPPQRLATTKSKSPVDSSEDESIVMPLEMPKDQLAIDSKVNVAQVSDEELAPIEKIASVSDETSDDQSTSSPGELAANPIEISLSQEAVVSAEADQPEPSLGTNTSEITTAESSAGSDKSPPLLTTEMDAEQLLAALRDCPTETREKALQQFIAAVADKADRTNRPHPVAEELAKTLSQMPNLPEAEVGSDSQRPERLASEQMPDENLLSGTESEKEVDLPEESLSVPPSELALPIANDLTIPSEGIVEGSDGSEVEEAEVTEVVETEVVETELVETELVETEVVAEVASEKEAMSDSGIVQASAEEPLERKDLIGQLGGNSLEISKMSEGELLAALILAMGNVSAEETEAERHRRLVKLGHLMVLAGDPNTAVESIAGVSEVEKEFLRHQLQGLWNMIDPDGHPVPSRRFSSVASEIREAAKFAAAATDSLEIPSIAFCTEIEAYGQVKLFTSQAFDSGQQVILYCEVENFQAAKTAEGFETVLQGSYEIYDSKDVKVFSQILPADRQVSANYLRDYFIAYQMFLPSELSSGDYRLQLTMEDVKGSKYGQANVAFQIKE